jgi:hypothetical protein
MSQSDRTASIDAAIMSVVRPQWLKVARIVSDAETALEGRTPQVGPGLTDEEQAEARDALLDAITERIEALVEARRLEGAGNLSNWRYSQVRLPRDA